MATIQGESKLNMIRHRPRKSVCEMVFYPIIIAFKK